MKDQKNGGVNPITAAVAGAVVGAGIAVAGVVLSDEKNRKKIKDFAETVQNQTEEKKKKLEIKLAKDKEIVRKVVNSAKDSIDKTTKEVNKAVKSL